jgi:mRNA interferase YafQ
MRDVRQLNRFRKDLQRMKKRGKKLEKLYDIVEKLAKGEQLLERNVAHPLVGEWKPAWDCHIEPDWILIYCVTDDSVELIRTGTHSDLF